jgi:monoamine oxidase
MSSHRSQLLASLHRAAKLASHEKHGFSEVLELPPVSRRQFLKMSLASSAVGLAAARGSSKAATGVKPTIAIIGAGMAGLTAALYLQEEGTASTIYEASRRASGRILTARNQVGLGLTTELGGEFIDSSHDDILQLVSAFKLKLIDLEDPALQRHAYFVHGRHRTEHDVIESFRHIIQQLKKDAASLSTMSEGKPVKLGYKNHTIGFDLDHISIDEYLDSLGCESWLHTILSAAYTTEYGLDTGDQSALNLLTLIGTDISNDKFNIFGTSDERYRIEGGNDSLTKAMEKHLETGIEFEHRLESIKGRGAGFSLSFARHGAASREVHADVVVMTIPFSVLRTIDMKIEMPEIKRRSIDELGYGTNAKIIAGFTGAPWRTQGFSGYTFTDESFMTGWESAHIRATESSAYTLLIGGQAGVDSRDGTARYQMDKFLPGIERAYPGASLAYANTAIRYHWPSNPYSLGCYASYKVGQWTEIGGAEIEPIGNLFFAGEHCSYDFQGFMNGAVQTGKTVAAQITKLSKR